MANRVERAAAAVVDPAVFYLRYTVLLTVFFFMSILRNVQFVYNKIRLRVFSMTYFPNNSPRVIRDDVNKLAKIPQRLSCIVNLRSDDDENGGVNGVIADIAELAAWCLSLGIPSLTIYEYNGSVKEYLPELKRYVGKNLLTYFGNPPPNFAIRIPHLNVAVQHSEDAAIDLEISLLSRVDGKPTIVELTKTISELSVNKELSLQDITVDLIDEELTELVGPEPDLVVCFGPVLDLQDYPPWHIRLSELYWEPDNTSVNYAVFIRALQKFAHSKVNLGK